METSTYQACVTQVNEDSPRPAPAVGWRPRATPSKIPPMSVKRLAIATLVLALAGLVVAAMISYTHAQLAQNIGSWCDVNATVSCSTVLSSEHAYLFGLPVAWFALAAYAAMAVAAAVILASPSAARRRQLATLLFVASAGSAVYSIYLAWIALGVLGAVCVQCAMLYAVNAGLLGATALLYGATQGGTRDQQTWQGRAKLIAAAALGVVLVLAASILWKTTAGGAPTTAEALCAREPAFCESYRSLPVVTVETTGGHHKGGDGAPVVIVEFSDFECGHCAKAYRNLKAVLPRFRDDVQVRFHHFPLDNACNPAIPAGGGHRFACLAAMAAECAAAQGKFWEYHDTLFDHQPQFDRDSLLGYAADLGLDREQFRACLESDAPRAAVARDVALATQLGVASTPTLFLNGRTLRGAPNADQLGYAIVLERSARQRKS